MNQEGIMRSPVKEREGQPAECNVGWKKHERQAVRGQTIGTQVIAVTSGKGGVGKTSVVANLGYALTRLNKRVLLVDADIGLANLDVILGFSPRYNLQHVLSGEARYFREWEDLIAFVKQLTQPRQEDIP